MNTLRFKRLAWLIAPRQKSRINACKIHHVILHILLIGIEFPFLILVVVGSVGGGGRGPLNNYYYTWTDFHSLTLPFVLHPNTTVSILPSGVGGTGVLATPNQLAAGYCFTISKLFGSLTDTVHSPSGEVKV